MTPILRHRAGGERAFERLYRRHVQTVYGYALALLRNPADAEDVTQTTFMNAYRAWRRGERPRSARAWLLAIAHNVCRERFRTAGRRVHEVALEGRVAEQAGDAGADLARADELRRALGVLPFNQRAALSLRELEGRSCAEIADVLGVSPAAVEMLLFRARRTLREQLDGELTCDEAALAISRGLDGPLARGERRALRAHLRSCPSCASEARSQRARRGALGALGVVPLPSSLASLFGGAGGATGTAAVTKAAVVVASGALVVGVGADGAERALRAAPVPHATPVAAAAAPLVASRDGSGPSGASRSPHAAHAEGTIRPQRTAGSSAKPKADAARSARPRTHGAQHEPVRAHGTPPSPNARAAKDALPRPHATGRVRASEVRIKKGKVSYERAQQAKRAARVGRVGAHEAGGHAQGTRGRALGLGRQQTQAGGGDRRPGDTGARGVGPEQTERGGRDRELGLG
jgi:RNA polymerase sigma factor (sigma-70 family)